MTKKDFLNELSKNLKRMPQSEINKSTDFYSELIDDKIEDGMSEEEAVASLGNTFNIAKKIIDESPFRNLYPTGTNEKIYYSSNTQCEVVNNQRKTPTWLIVLLSVTAIVWVPVAFALIVSLGAVLVSLIAVVFALAISGVGVIIISPFAFLQLGGAGGVMIIGTGFVLLGIGILGAIGMICLFKGFVHLTKLIFNSSKKGFNKGDKN